jgi:hypothetical protein
MNFKQFFYEEHDPFTPYVRYMTEDELIKIGMRLEKHKDQYPGRLVEYLDFNKGWYVDFGFGVKEYIITFNTSWKGEDHLGYAFEVNPPLYSRIGRVPKGNGGACKAVEQFEFKQQLTPSAQETFGDLIDEL